MQCDDATAHYEDFVDDSSLNHKPSSQSEYFTHWELVMFYAKEMLWKYFIMFEMWIWYDDWDVNMKWC
jgi:hypothetical protein